MPIVTLDSIKNQRGESDEDDAGGNEYFTGGLGNQGGGSGLAVMAPNQGGGPQELLAHRLNQLQRAQAARGDAVEASEQERVVSVTVYRNGFVVGDGPLRTMDEPRNQAFMESVVQGFCPEELAGDGQGAVVKLENRLHEDYNGQGRAATAASARYVPFGGAGATVGEGAVHAGEAIVPGTHGVESTVNWKDAGPDMIRVQIRFANGKKEVANFNKTDTIHHLVTVVESIQPGLGPYLLLSGSPPKRLDSSQFHQTLVESGLAGAMVMVKETG